jgi:glycolate oxidase FAD binding subunit
MVGADKLMFAGDPPSPVRCTVGGLLAAASHGPRRHGYGAVRDYCIGVRFVTGDGRRAKGGGRVVKNVAGYDLMKLLIGSYGTLALITSASFKLFPAPRQTRTFLAELQTAKEALAFRDRVMRSPLSPMCLELVSPGARRLMRPEMADDAWVICVRASGSDDVLARYRKELGSAISRELERVAENEMWHAIQNFPDSTQASNDGRSVPEASNRIQITLPPGGVLSIIETLDPLSAGGEIGIAMTGRVGVGHLQAVVWDRIGDPSAVVSKVVVALRKSGAPDLSMRVEGALNPWPITPANLASMRAVKQALDPKNILRGREIF